jgi:hypothetical protein
MDEFLRIKFTWKAFSVREEQSVSSHIPSLLQLLLETKNGLSCSVKIMKKMPIPFESFRRQLCVNRLFEHFAPGAKIPQPAIRNLKSQHHNLRKRKKCD